MFGVSPAFVVSLYGPKFTVSDFCRALSVMSKLGFEAFQPEIFTADALPDWQQEGAATVAKSARELNLMPTQFVAHFMHSFFASPEMLTPEKGTEQLKQAIECAKAFDGCGVLTIPVLPFEADVGRFSLAGYADLRKRLVEKIDSYVRIVSDAGLLLAFEIVPFSILGNSDGLLEVCRELDTPRLGINLDTGHAWAAREMVPLLPFKLHGRIFGLHLKDNNSDTNLPLAPGKGTVDWAAFLANLDASGYTGSLDIEIGCVPEEVEDEYRDGMSYLKSLTLQ